MVDTTIKECRHGWNFPCRECFKERISALESALVEIRDHPHSKPSDSPCTGLRCTDKEIDAWRIVGQIQAHRCCAEIARRGLEKK